MHLHFHKNQAHFYMEEKMEVNTRPLHFLLQALTEAAPGKDWEGIGCEVGTRGQQAPHALV